jgi:hypothetical protein
MKNYDEIINFARQKTFFVSGLGIEVMANDMGKANYYETEEYFLKPLSSEGWRLPSENEGFILWTIKQEGAGNIKDYYYWTGERHFNPDMAYIFRMDEPFLASRSKEDLYFVRLVRSIPKKY